MYCQHCGNALPEVEAVEAEAEAGAVEVDTIASADVEIAKINAQRDVQLARIAAGAVDVDQAVDLAHAEGIAEGIVAASAPPDAEGDPAPPVEVIVPEGAGDADGAEGNPPPESEGSSAPPPPARSSIGWYS
jgi:hypothetical protein